LGCRLPVSDSPNPPGSISASFCPAKTELPVERRRLPLRRADRKPRRVHCCLFKSSIRPHRNCDVSIGTLIGSTASEDENQSEKKGQNCGAQKSLFPHWGGRVFPSPGQNKVFFFKKPRFLNLKRNRGTQTLYADNAHTSVMNPNFSRAFKREKKTWPNPFVCQFVRLSSKAHRQILSFTLDHV